MTKQTKQLFIISLVTLSVSTVAAGAFFLKVESGRQKLEEQTKILSENNAKEFSYIRLKKLVNETESDRKALSQMFFANEGDSIDFLGEAEAVAAQLNLDLKTEALDKVTSKEKGDSIKITFSYEGTEAAVLKFSKLMELVPYHSKLESLDLKKVNDGVWLGRLTLLITIQPYDKQ